jgi:hypothetical protein
LFRSVGHSLFSPGRLSRGEAARELGNEENSDWVRKQLKEALDPKDRDTVEV